MPSNLSKKMENGKCESRPNLNFSTFQVGLQKRCLLSPAIAKTFGVTTQPWTPWQSLPGWIDGWTAWLISREKGFLRAKLPPEWEVVWYTNAKYINTIKRMRKCQGKSLRDTSHGIKAEARWGKAQSVTKRWGFWCPPFSFVLCLTSSSFSSPPTSEIISADDIQTTKTRFLNLHMWVGTGGSTREGAFGQTKQISFIDFHSVR